VCTWLNGASSAVVSALVPMFYRLLSTIFSATSSGLPLPPCVQRINARAVDLSLFFLLLLESLAMVVNAPPSINFFYITIRFSIPRTELDTWHLLWRARYTWLGVGLVFAGSLAYLASPAPPQALPEKRGRAMTRASGQDKDRRA